MPAANSENLYQLAILNFSFIEATNLQKGVMKSGFRNIDALLGGLTLA